MKERLVVCDRCCRWMNKFKLPAMMMLPSGRAAFLQISITTFHLSQLPYRTAILCAGNCCFWSDCESHLPSVLLVFESRSYLYAAAQFGSLFERLTRCASLQRGYAEPASSFMPTFMSVAMPLASTSLQFGIHTLSRKLIRPPGLS